MMNLVAICLVVTSLLTAEVLSPTQSSNQIKKNQVQDDVIVKEGHRVVVVEYDQENHHHNTKVLISPEEKKKSSSVIDNAKEKIKETASVLPNVGQGISSVHHDEHESTSDDDGHPHSARELICDAYGKCKQKIASAIGKAKDKTAETVCKTTEAVGQEKEKYTQKAEDVKGGVKEAVEKTKENVKEKVDEGKDKYAQKAQYAKERVRDSVRTVAGHIEQNATEEVRKIRENLMEKAKRLMKLVPAGATGVMDLMNLLGFASAFGMCLWVTFVSSYVLAGALPRQQFGVVQSRIYPVYFKAMGLSIGFALLGHIWRLFAGRAGLFQGYNLLAAFLLVLTNAMYLEPRATKTMFERMKIEKEEGRGREASDITSHTTAEPHCGTTDPATTITAETTRTTTTAATTTTGSEQEGAVRTKMVTLSERLKKLNTYSSILNVLTLMSLSWHLVYLAQRLTVG